MAYSVKNNKKGIALVLALIVMSILFLFGTAYLSMMLSEAGIARNQENSEKAFFVAEAGVQRAIRLLVDDDNYRTASLVENFSSGTYTLVIADDPTLTNGIKITSTGQVGGAKRISIVRLILAASLLDYALFASDTSDPGTADINCSGANGNIKGDVHANGSATMGSVTITNGTLTQGDQGADQQPMITVDMDYYKQIATNVYTGNITINTNQKEKIIYVQAGGNPYTPGIATITASGSKLRLEETSVVAEGGILINGNKELQMTYYDEENKDLVALATKTGNITESGSATKNDRDIKGMIFSEQGNIQFQNIKLQGAVYAKNDTLTNNVDIQYKADKLPTSGFLTLAYYEWQESF